MLRLGVLLDRKSDDVLHGQQVLIRIDDNIAMQIDRRGARLGVQHGMALIPWMAQCAVDAVAQREQAGDAVAVTGGWNQNVEVAHDAACRIVVETGQQRAVALEEDRHNIDFVHCRRNRHALNIDLCIANTVQAIHGAKIAVAPAVAAA
jgi:hypothetical protein